MLCSNRFPLPGSLSTCVLDTAIIPLPSFLLLAGLVTFFILYRPSDKGIPRTPPPKWPHTAYITLVVAAFAMTILEIARLAADNLGVGLLPVSSTALISVIAVLWRERDNRTSEMSILLACYWLLITVFEIIKSIRLHKLMMLNPTTTKTSKYPSSDQFLDNVVMIGLFFVFLCMECATLVSLRQTKKSLDNVELHSIDELSKLHEYSRRD